MRSGNLATGLSRLAGAGRNRTALLGGTLVAAAAVTAGLALPAAASPAAAAGSARVWGTEHFQTMNTSTSANVTTSPLIAYGLFTAAGTDRENSNGTDTFSFPGGSFLVKHAAAKGSGQPSFNAKTCLFTYSEKGTFKVSDGTGKYRGIAGGGTYALSVVGIGAKLKNGTCDPSQTAPAAAQQQEIQAVGRVSLR
jgi:hypothetical protein